MHKSFASSKQQQFLRVLRDIREEAGLRQIDIAKRLGQPQSFVSKYESGERRLDFLELEAICAACNTDLPTFVARYSAQR